jgi:hypothetical protein
MLNGRIGGAESQKISSGRGRGRLNTDEFMKTKADNILNINII